MPKLILDVNLGANLQKLRKSKNLTQEQVCTKLDLVGRPMSQSTYAKIETNTRNIFASDLIALAGIFEVSFDEIFNGLKPINKYELKK